jgi:hypothetical protein
MFFFAFPEGTLSGTILFLALQQSSLILGLMDDTHFMSV